MPLKSSATNVLSAVVTVSPKVFAVGAAFDVQKDFHGYDADAFFDHPLGSGALTVQFDYSRYDGGRTLTTLPEQNDVLLEAGYLIRALKLTPVLQIARRALEAWPLAN